MHRTHTCATIGDARRSRRGLAARTAAAAAVAIAGLALLVTAGTSSSTAASGSSGVASKKVPKRLEDAVEQAMRGNPDVLLAESVVQQARAELNAVKLGVARDLTQLYAARRGAQEGRRIAAERISRLEVLVEDGRVSSVELQDAIAGLGEADARVTEIEAQIRYLVGQGGDVASQEKSRSAKPERRLVAVRHRDTSEKHEEWLAREVSIDFGSRGEGEEEDPLTGRDVADALAREIEGLRFVTRAMDGDPLADFDLDLDVEVLSGSVESILMMLSDVGSVAFLARDYGFLVMYLHAAREVQAPAIPRELPYLQYNDR